MKKLSKQELIDLVLNSYDAERTNRVAKNLSLVSDNFHFTDMVVAPDKTVFPRVGGEALRKLMKEAFSIKGRQFVFKTIVADEQTQTVVIEFIESYPDPKSGQVYTTPQVSICKITDGKISSTRHYMDPRLSFMNLSNDVIEHAFDS